MPSSFPGFPSRTASAGGGKGTARDSLEGREGLTSSRLVHTHEVRAPAGCHPSPLRSAIHMTLRTRLQSIHPTRFHPPPFSAPSFPSVRPVLRLMCTLSSPLPHLPPPYSTCLASQCPWPSLTLSLCCPSTRAGRRCRRESHTMLLTTRPAWPRVASGLVFCFSAAFVPSVC